MVSRDFAGASLARRLHLEGHEVRAFVQDPTCDQILHGLIDRVPGLDAGLDWVGRDGLIVVDDCGFGEWQDAARADGFAVVGGSGFGDRLERDRAFAQAVLEEAGIPTLPVRKFPDCTSAFEHLDQEQRPWVVKFDGHAPKAATFVGELPCGSDAADFLALCVRHCQTNGCGGCGPVLQPKLDGHEIGVARYFDGQQWVGPIELNIEHKRLCAGSLGPNTYEMGTLLWYSDSHPLFDRMLAPLADHLRQGGHRGDIDVNCIVNQEGIFPLELTPRFGWPATHAQMALHTTPWADFLHGIASGRPVDPRPHPGYAVATFLAVPPFPFAAPRDARGATANGMSVRFRRPLTPDEHDRLHLESVALRRDRHGHDHFVVCDDSGYLAHATGRGPCPDSARRQALDLARLVAVPGIFFREDIAQNAESTIRQVENLLASMR